MEKENKEVKKIKYSWDKFDQDIKDIVETIKTQGWNIKVVFGIPNGGLPLAAALANHLDIKLITDLNVMAQIQDVSIFNQVLVVDDISDTGRTMITIPGIIDMRTVALFVKAGSQFLPNYYCNTCKREEWVVFPWEPEEKDAERDNTYEEIMENIDKE